MPLRPRDTGPDGALPRQLTVIYDRDCQLCIRCRRWILNQPWHVAFRFIAAQETWVQDWLGPTVPAGDELVVIDENGHVWVGPDAFIVCLWGLADHRSTAGRLQNPGMKPVAKAAFHALSAGRGVTNLFLTNPEPAAVADVSCGC